MERLMAAQGSRGGQENNYMLEMIKKSKKVFEINPKHPLIIGLLSRVPLSTDETDTELSQILRTLWDTSLVRSGFNVADTNSYFERIENLLRKSVGVDQDEKIEVGEIKPAPEVEVGPTDGRSKEEIEESLKDKDGDGSEEEKNEEWKDWSKVKEELKNKKTDHDESKEKKDKKDQVVDEKKAVSEDDDILDVLDDDSSSTPSSSSSSDPKETLEGMKEQMEKLEEMMKTLKDGSGKDGMPDFEELMKGFKDEL